MARKEIFWGRGDYEVNHCYPSPMNFTSKTAMSINWNAPAYGNAITG